MNDLLRMALINAAMAGVLALVAAAACRFVRRPPLVHALWLLVLLKLLSPPVVGLAVLPPPAAEHVAPTPEAALRLPNPGAPPFAAGDPFLPPPPASSEPATRPLDSALALWLAGTLAVLALAVARGGRFRRLLRSARPAPAPLGAAAEAIARRMGVRRCPEVRVVPAAVSPMLWWRGRSVWLLFPERLLAELSVAERDSLLAHEMAHLRRRDHWVRLLEVAATAGFWWHPAVWWARTRLRRAEERSCDAWVVRALPGSSRAYADALLKTLSFLSDGRRRLPALASGVGGARDYEERLTMILKRTNTAFLSRWHRLSLAAAALAALVVFPTWAERGPEPAGAVLEPAGLWLEMPGPEPTGGPGPEPTGGTGPEPTGGPGLDASCPEPCAGPEGRGPAGAGPEACCGPAAGGPAEACPGPCAEPDCCPADGDGCADAHDEAELRYRDLLRELELQAAELQDELREVLIRQNELRREWQEARRLEEMERLAERVDRLQAGGHAEQAENLRREREILEHRLAAQRDHFERTRAEAAEVRATEAYREMASRVAAAADPARAEFLRDRLAMVTEELRGVREGRERLDEEMSERETRLLRERAEWLREAGQLEKAEQAERLFELMIQRREAMERQRPEAIRRQILVLEQIARELEAGGGEGDAERLLERVEELEKSLPDPI